MQRKAEIRITSLPAYMQEGLTVRSYQKSKRGDKELSPKPSEGSWPCQHVGFRFLGSRSVRDYSAAGFGQQFCGYSLQRL